MKTVRTCQGHGWRVVGGVALALSALCAFGGDFRPPLYVGNTQPILDEFNRNMAGSHLLAEAGARSLVEIRVVLPGDGGVETNVPPDVNGLAATNNPLLSDKFGNLGRTSGSVGGLGMNCGAPDSGLFCMVFPEPPPAGTKIFARAFNAPTAEQASFYSDSAVVAVPAKEATLVFNFNPVAPLDDGDDDGDGLINSLEESYGTDGRPAVDFDEDGLTDYDEWLAGTNPADARSSLTFEFIRRLVGAAASGLGEGWISPVRIQWQSVPGKSYQLEYTDTLAGEQQFEPLGEAVTAEEGESEIAVDVDLEEDDARVFRLRLVPE